jgi:hypothetical protein
VRTQFPREEHTWGNTDLVRSLKLVNARFRLTPVEARVCYITPGCVEITAHPDIFQPKDARDEKGTRYIGVPGLVRRSKAGEATSN